MALMKWAVQEAKGSCFLWVENDDIEMVCQPLISWKNLNLTRIHRYKAARATSFRPGNGCYRQYNVLPQ
jgi:hypothetical protein